MEDTTTANTECHVCTVNVRGGKRAGTLPIRFACVRMRSHLNDSQHMHTAPGDTQPAHAHALLTHGLTPHQLLCVSAHVCNNISAPFVGLAFMRCQSLCIEL